jgi:hypothetical protein
MLLMMLDLHATVLPMMLKIGKEWRCDFSVCVFLGRVTYCLFGYFVDFVDFACLVQASQPVEPVQASSPHFLL